MEVLSSNGLSVDINGADFVLEIEIGPQETIVFDNRVSGLKWSSRWQFGSGTQLAIRRNR